MPTLSAREFDTISYYLSALFGGINAKDIALVVAVALLLWGGVRFLAQRVVCPEPYKVATIVFLDNIVPLTSAPLAIPVSMSL